MMAEMNITFIGLGRMGSPMASHLVRRSHSVVAYNRSPDRAQAWHSQSGGAITDDLPASARVSDVVTLCVSDDSAVEDILIREAALLTWMKPGSIIIDHTTTSADTARRMAEAARSSGIEYLDAPISGGTTGATNGTLTIMVGGSSSALEQTFPLLEAYGKTIAYMGESGSGQLTKMVNQLCIAGALQGVAEALRFGQNSGLDMERVVPVIAGGAGQSWQLENRGPTILANKFDFGFSVDLMHKDLSICLAEAARNGSELPLTRMVEARYGELQSRGSGALDFSSLALLLPKNVDG